MNFNISDYRYPFDIYSLYRCLKKSTFYSFQQLVDLQNEKLKIIVNHAYHNVPYYKELFDNEGLSPNDIQTVKDLVHVPVLTKDILRERFDDLTAINSKQFKPNINRTSGSTGTPLQFLQDKNVSIARFAFFWHIYQMAGYKPYMRWAQIDQMYLPENGKIWRFSLPLNSLQISAISITEANTQKILKKIERFKPGIIRGYPSAIYLFACFVKQQSLKINFNLKSIITGAETLHQFQKEMIEEVFNCKVFDVYSMWEAVCLISECDKHRKHQHMEFSVMELLDENNQLVENGKTGEITATSFYNYSMPFIRYKTGDLAKLSNEICNCGRSHLIVSKLQGRKADQLFSTKGDLVPFQGFQIGKFSSYDGLKGLIQTQIIQNSYKEVEVHLVIKEPNRQEPVKKEISSTLKKRLGNDLKIDFILTDSIKKEKNGKASFVINNLLRSNPKQQNN